MTPKTTRALALACATVIPTSAALADSVIDGYQFTGETLNPTTLASPLVGSTFGYVNANPGSAPFQSPFIVPGGILPDDPAFYIAQSGWLPTPFANEDYYTLNVSVPPGMAINVSSFNFEANSRQQVPYLTQIQYSAQPSFASPVAFDANPFSIPTQEQWNSFSATDNPLTAGIATHYFRIYNELDPNGDGSVSDLLNMGNFALVGSVQPYAGVTPMYWDPAAAGTFGSGGSGTWIGANTWADGIPDYPWSNTIAESANFGGASGGVVSLGSNVIAVNGINFTAPGYTIAAAAGQTLTLAGAINTAADATLSAAIVNTAAGAIVKTGAAALTLAGPVNFVTGTSIQVTAGNLVIAPGVSVVVNGAAQEIAGANAVLTIQPTASFSTDSPLNVADQPASSGSVNQFGQVAASTVTLATGNSAAVANYTLSGGALTTSNITGGPGASTFTFNGGAVMLTGPQPALFSGVASVLVQNAGAAIDTGANTVSLAQSLTPAPGSTGGLVKLGSGTLIFGNTTNINIAYNAGAVINVEAGQLTGSSDFQGIWTNNLAALIVAAGATFDAVEAGQTGIITIDALLGAGTVKGGYFGTTTFDIGVAGGSGTFSGTLEDDPDAQVAVTKIGSGTQALAGSNTYSGPTTVSAGTLRFVGGVVPSATAAVAAGAVLEYNESARAFQSPITYTGAGTLLKTGPGNLIFGGFGAVNVDLSRGALIDVEAGELTGSSSFQGLFTANQSSLNIASGALFDAVEAGNIGAMQFDALTGGGTFSGGFSGAFNATSTITLGVAGGGGTFSGDLIDDAGAHLAIIKSGSGTQSFSGSNSYTGGTKLTGGALIVGSSAGLPLGPVTVGTATLLQLAPGVGHVNIGTLAINGNGRVDITNNRLTLNYGSPAADPLSAIRADLVSGYNNGSWTGSGITSSTAALLPGKFALGYLDGNNSADTLHKTVAANQMVIAYTLAGDAFLENTVGFDDLVVVAENFGKTGEDWAGGNFNYDPNGSVGFIDLVDVAKNFGAISPVNQSVGATLSPAWQAASAVPEPAASVFLVTVVTLFTRRRKSQTNK